ncbi:phosphopantetheine-binding protein, partial [Burkholderia pseudomallei]|uniref:phosphopantetheine-binding protein n=1 Tax=Burkholderia pseudomallei TaxID=28450 RepID=UPI0021F6C96F
IRIPTYRFDRQRYWVEPGRAPRDAGATGRVAAAGATAGRPASLAALETTLLAQWRTLLGAPALRGTDNVFEHGADSLTVGQFVSQLISEHALPVHVVDCYSQPSVGGQARLLGERIGLDLGAAQRVAAGPRETDVEKFEHL